MKRGTIVIPKTEKEERMVSNITVSFIFHFIISYWSLGLKQRLIADGVVIVVIATGRQGYGGDSDDWHEAWISEVVAWISFEWGGVWVDV